MASVPAPIQASGVDATANAGVSVSVEVATFTDPDPVANGLDFSATVTAGSGSATFSDPTIVEEGNGKFEVVVNSSDSDAETVEICVAVTAPGDKTATVESNVTFNAALPTLELTSVATPGPQIYTSNEGRWMWATGWNLEGATNNTEGWILQQITYNYKCINKSNEDVTAAVFSQRAFPPAASYWEAWKVVNGKVWWPPKSNLTAWSSSWSTKLGNWARGSKQFKEQNPAIIEQLQAGSASANQGGWANKIADVWWNHDIEGDFTFGTSDTDGLPFFVQTAKNLPPGEMGIGNVPLAGTLRSAYNLPVTKANPQGGINTALSDWLKDNTAESNSVFRSVTATWTANSATPTNLVVFGAST